MKTVNETFTDEEHDKLLKAKKDLSWHDFILAKADIEFELDNIRRASGSLQIPSILEEVHDEAVHVKMARKASKVASDRLYGVSMRHKKGKNEEAEK